MACEKNKPELSNDQAEQVNGGHVLLAEENGKVQIAGVPINDINMSIAKHDARRSYPAKNMEKNRPDAWVSIVARDVTL